MTANAPSETSGTYACHVAKLTLLVGLGLSAWACGSAKKEDCADSVLDSFSGECDPSSSGGNSNSSAGNSASAGNGASAGRGSTGGSSGKGGDSGRGGGGDGPPAPASAACLALGSLPDGSKGQVSDAKPVVVYEWGKAGNEDSLDPGDEWFVDNDEGVLEGDTALHPPPLKPNQEPALEFDCGGKEHTQLAFAVRRAAENTELELFDGATSRGKVSVGYGFATQIINVDPGKHKYKFVARNLGTTPIGVPYVLDAFICKNAAPGAGDTGLVTFDDAFVPIELGGGWFVDNMRGVHQGEAAVHPPVLRPGDEPVMTFDCAGAEHTQLSFVVHRAAENTELELCDGTTSRGKINVGYGFASQVIDVAPGEHRYTFVARNLGTTDIAEPYVIDTLACKHEEPVPGYKGLVTFDAGFVPVELNGWFVDNMRGAHEGEAAVHPPVIEGHDETSMTFDCSEQPHKQFSFVVHRAAENTELELFEGPKSRGTIDVGYGFASKTYQVDSGVFTFVARNLGTTQITEPYVLDTFSCK